MDVRVFLVEDLGRTRNTLVELLDTIEGFRVIGCASTEAEANLWLDENSGGWDLAVIDLMLEQGSGMGVLARIESLHPGSLRNFLERRWRKIAPKKLVKEFDAAKT